MTTPSQELWIRRAVHSPNGTFSVAFEADGAEHAVTCAAKDLESFAAFRRAVLGALGVLVRDPDFEGGWPARLASKLWLDNVERAIEEGKEQ